MASPEKAAALARMKFLATGLLVAVAVLFVLARREGWPWVAAFAEAAMIGALADWFAVVALFRHPLGLPIPHTAILPRNKARLADNLAVFIRDKFLDTASLVGRLRAANPAERIAGWLQDEANARLLADRLALVLVQSLDFMDDKRVRRLVLHALRRRAGSLDLAGSVGRIMNVLTEDGRHQGLLDEGLRRLVDWFAQPGVQQGFAGMIVDVAQKEYPKVVAMLGLVGINPNELGEKVSVGIAAGVTGLLEEVARDPDHPRRAAFDELVRGYIERLQHDDAFRARIEQTKRDFLAHPGVATYLQELWDELHAWLIRDVGRPDSRVRRKLAAAASAVGASLAANPALRDSVNEHIERSVERLAPELRDGLSHHIAGTVRAWNDADLVREIEQSVGRDLQFIRLNGTLVGGLIGVLLYAVTHLIT
ncbi:DUF445 domain-containing protein [Zoogloea sp.]|uniref:DUF445 domain-containing protein n=1 Tax=Zoogloea sp. TaxID=49181 RepID=UPI0035B451C2